MEAARALREVAFWLERSGESTYRVRAYRNAAAVVDEVPPDELRRRAENGTLTELSGIGKSTAKVIEQVHRQGSVDYLTELRARTNVPEPGPLRRALRGDCHTHSDWSDGGSPIHEMAETAQLLGHDYVVLTDHSPRLTVANGLSPDRLRAQLRLVAELNERLAPFRILTGIEVDILDDGSLDQEPELLAQLDVVVASVHSKLRMDAAAMTRRMVHAVRNPHTDILGHCTGRMVTGNRQRPPSTFDSAAVFQACRENGVAVEINSRPERLDPPRALLAEAVDTGCLFAIDSDAHAPGQLDWLPFGCARAEDAGVPPDRIVNTRPVADLLDWTASHEQR